jgi:hypothetical protein
MNDMPSPHPAAVARNWRAVVGLDFLLGLATVMVGVILAIGSHRGAGVILSLLGTVYATLVAMRARRWARMRRDAQVGD